MKAEVQTAARGFSWTAALRARHILLPAEHGAWVFLFSPLIIGLAAGGLHLASLFIVLAALAAFLLRQPVNIAVKVASGRRPKSEMPAAWLWLCIYGFVGAFAASALVGMGYAFVLALAIPALPVFAWHLWLVSRRAERRQALVEIAGSGVLALAAPAAYWAGRGQSDPNGWVLWLLCWLQVAGTILYAYLRLEQRQLKQIPGLLQRLKMARLALAYNWLALLLVFGLSITQVIPTWLFLAYAIQPLEVAWGIYRPAVGMKPRVIGFRQLAVSILFTLTFAIAWSL